MFEFIISAIITFLIIYKFKNVKHIKKIPELFDNNVYVDENKVCYRYKTTLVSNKK